VPKAPAALKPQPAATAPAPPRNHDALNGTATRFAILAGRIHTVGKGTITDGVILVKDGKIEAVGTRAEGPLPDGHPVVTAAVVTPGLIDAHTCVPPAGALNLAADKDQDEMSDPNQADLRILDGFNPGEPLLEFLRREGVTVVRACPGRA